MIKYLRRMWLKLREKMTPDREEFVYPIDSDLEPCLFILDVTYNHVKDMKMYKLKELLDELKEAEDGSRLARTWVEKEEGNTRIIEARMKLYLSRDEDPYNLKDHPDALSLIRHLRGTVQELIESGPSEASYMNFQSKVLKQKRIIASMLHIRGA